MKKILSMILVLAMVFTAGMVLTGCEDDNDTPENGYTTPAPGIEEESPAPSEEESPAPESEEATPEPNYEEPEE